MSETTLRPIAVADLDTVAVWLAAEENYKWLDFGAGVQVLSKTALAVMVQRRHLHSLRIYACGNGGKPAGLVGLSNISSDFRSATLWYVLGDKSRSRQGLTTRAVAAILEEAFGELGLQSVNAWTVEKNNPSMRVLENNGFRLIGRQRNCHLVDGQLEDRLHFDLLAEDHGAVFARGHDRAPFEGRRRD